MGKGSGGRGNGSIEGVSPVRECGPRCQPVRRRMQFGRPMATRVLLGPLPPDVYGSKADAIGGGAAEVRLTAAPCQQLRYGLTEGGTVAIDAPDPLRNELAAGPLNFGQAGTSRAARS